MMRALGTRLRASWLATLLLACGPALAHKGSDAYLDVRQLEAPASPSASAGADGLVDFSFGLAVALRDLDLVVTIDANADASVTWGEVKAATPQVLALLNQTARLDAPPGGPEACRLAWQGDGLERRSDGVYFRAVAQARCPPGQALRLDYALLKDQDSTHRLLVAGRINGHDLLSTVSPQQGSLLLNVGNAEAGNAEARTTQASSRWSALRDYFSLGMHHLLQGYDHLAFLLALVLPLQLSLRRRPQLVVSRASAAGATAAYASRASAAGATAAYASRATWLALLRTVTAFTLGHSVTLMLATFGWTQASPLWVEPVIALSIAVTALLNLHPVKGVRFDVLALLFGLVHGFGFAGLLQEAAAPGGLLPWALAGFNLGVEAGQLTAVMGWVLVSQALVGRAWYGRVVVRGGSAVLVLLAGGWFWQRVS
ncbi:HupE/UreJ family protein [Polaromonas hydrogenivorans]|uniref:HupE/UreJ family protein n=1 Tax=Polaromonas hydrogenivorans TaxID=335476 RepID=A0AAU7LW41_9BURK